MNRRPQDGPQRPQEATQRPVKENPRPDAAGPYKGIYRAVYDYHSRHGPFPAGPDGWQEAAADLAQLVAAAGGNPFLKSLLMAVYDEMERRHKAAKNGGQRQTNKG